MTEREPRKEIVGKGELFYLGHPGTKDTFSGYGLTTWTGSKDFLVGLLMVDRPDPADPAWLERVQKTFGEYQLVPMTATGERGIACHMQVVPDSVDHLRQFPSQKSAAITKALEPFLKHPPRPAFLVRWDQEAGLWRSQLASPGRLPDELRQVFERTGYGCLAAEASLGVVHVCHAPDRDIEGFRNKPVFSQWQLALMPTAPVIRLELTVMDRPESPYLLESFLNVGHKDQARVLARLSDQEELYLAFYGDDFTHRFTKIIKHDDKQREQLNELVGRAIDHRGKIPAHQRDFNRAKADLIRLLG